MTLPAHASMFTGLYPDQHRGGHANPLDPLPSSPDAPPTLAELLRDAGWDTALIASHVFLGELKRSARRSELRLDRGKPTHRPSISSS